MNLFNNTKSTRPSTNVTDQVLADLSQIELQVVAELRAAALADHADLIAGTVFRPVASVTFDAEHGTITVVTEGREIRLATPDATIAEQVVAQVSLEKTYLTLWLTTKYAAATFSSHSWEYWLRFDALSAN